jgi:hypothetical protein
VIRTNATLKNEAGNIFTMDGNHGATSLRVDVDWIDNTTLRIAYPQKARVFSQKKQIHDILIQYTTLEKLADKTNGH